MLILKSQSMALRAVGCNVGGNVRRKTEDKGEAQATYMKKTRRVRHLDQILKSWRTTLFAAIGEARAWRTQFLVSITSL